MTIEDFKKLLEKNTPPENINPLLLSLWYDAKGNWKLAHETAQEIASNDGSWIHAYLHRKEGDKSNASYWYSRAGKKMPSYSLDKEWEEILSDLIAKL
ncbi:MAG TPA: hypothetical protein VGK25_05070 [Ignavibacteria bacterium]|jgi:hypothetical protein